MEEVGRRGLERPGGEGLAVGRHQIEAVDDGTARRDRGARRDRWETGDVQVGIAVPMLDLVRRNAEALGREPREDGRMPLAGRLDAEGENHPLAAGKRNRGAFGRLRAGVLEKAGDAE